MTGKANHLKTESENEIARRRKMVAANLLAGLTYREIAGALNVSLGTIASDRKAILQEWKKHYTQDYDKWIQIQLRRLDVMLNAIWDQARDGSLKHIETAMSIMERQESLLGVKKYVELSGNLNVNNSVAPSSIDAMREIFQTLRQREQEIYDRDES